MDLDTFYVSVERLRDASLNGKPIIVGGGNRGVVAACSYEARRFGIHSAMPIAMARRLCPSAIFLKGDMETYIKYSDTVTEIIAGSAPLFEKSSIDEFYLDLTGMDRFFGTQKWAWALGDTIKKETGLSISMGLSVNKTVCKIATGEAKPNGRLQIASPRVKEFLHPLPLRKMPMAGKVTVGFLGGMGIHTIGMLAEFPPELLLSTLGKNGLSLWKRAQGIDDSPVVAHTDPKSISTERTFDEDTTDIRFLHATLLSEVEKLGYRLRSANHLTNCITVSIRYSDFQAESRQMTIAYTCRDDVLYRAALDLFKKCYGRRVLLRRVGVRLSGLVHGSHQIDLFDASPQQLNLMLAMDKIRDRYGLEAVGHASAHQPVPRGKAMRNASPLRNTTAFMKR